MISELFTAGSDREIVMEAVKQDGRALQCASAELQGDREIVMEAVKQNGDALRYASAELRGDREIVLEAMAHLCPRGWTPPRLQWASPELRDGGFVAHLDGLREHSFNVPRDTFIATILRASTGTSISTSSTGNGDGANGVGSGSSTSTGGGRGCALALLRPSAALPRSLSTVIKQLIGDYAGLRIGPKWRVIERAAANFGFVN